MKNILRFSLIAIAALSFSCENPKTPDTPTPTDTPSQEQINFTANTKMVSITTSGTALYTLDFNVHQINVIGQVYNIIDDKGVISRRLELSSAPTLDAVVDVTYSTVDSQGVATPTTYSDLKVVKIEGGFVYLWSEATKTGVALPVLI